MRGAEPCAKVMTATLSEDRAAVHLRKGLWSIEFPIEQLPKWLRFYRELRDRRSGQFARFYAADVGVLEAVEKELRDGG